MMPFSNLAIIDIETTGGDPQRDRIIEVAVVLIDNNTITRQWSALIQPGLRIDPMITTLTGITDRDLETAPDFAQIADELWSLLEGRIFVAHFARFDYGFIKQEFARVGRSFKNQQLCSVKLSRALFPTQRGHGLDAIIDRFHLECKHRHRALGDAIAVWDFFCQLPTVFENSVITQAISRILLRPALPAHLPTHHIDRLPNTSGVYIFYDERGTPIYVGKSIKIKDRVLSHFYESLDDAKEQRLAQQVHAIEHYTTAGELEALLKESALVKQLQPVYNRQLRARRELHILTLKQVDGYLTFSSDRCSSVTRDMLQKNNLAVFHSKRGATNAVQKICEEFSLCAKLTGLEKTTESCFSYGLGQCAGACKRAESAQQYNLRAQAAFKSLRIATWPFSGPVTMSEYNEATDQSAVHTFDQWCHIRTAHSQDEYDRIGEPTATITFDIDVYHILRGFIRKHPSRCVSTMGAGVSANAA